MTQKGSYNLISSKSLFYHSKRKQIGNAWSANLRKETIPNIYIIFTFSVAGRRKLDLLSCADTESFKKPHYILNGLQNRPLTWRNFHKLKKKKKKKAVTKNIALIFFFFPGLSLFITVKREKTKQTTTTKNSICASFKQFCSLPSLLTPPTLQTDLANFQLWNSVKMENFSKTILKLSLEFYFW